MLIEQTDIPKVQQNYSWRMPRELNCENSFLMQLEGSKYSVWKTTTRFQKNQCVERIIITPLLFWWTFNSSRSPTTQAAYVLKPKQIKSISRLTTCINFKRSKKKCKTKECKICFTSVGETTLVEEDDEDLCEEAPLIAWWDKVEAVWLLAVVDGELLDTVNCGETGR